MPQEPCPFLQTSTTLSLTHPLPLTANAIVMTTVVTASPQTVNHRCRRPRRVTAIASETVPRHHLPEMRVQAPRTPSGEPNVSSRAPSRTPPQAWALESWVPLWVVLLLVRRVSLPLRIKALDVAARAPPTRTEKSSFQRSWGPQWVGLVQMPSEKGWKRPATGFGTTKTLGKRSHKGAPGGEVWARNGKNAGQGDRAGKVIIIIETLSMMGDMDVDLIIPSPKSPVPSPKSKRRWGRERIIVPSRYCHCPSSQPDGWILTRTDCRVSSSRRVVFLGHFKCHGRAIIACNLLARRHKPQTLSRAASYL